MTTEQVLALIYEQLQTVLAQQDMESERLLAVSRQMRRLADALSSHADRHAQDDGELAKLSESVDGMALALNKLYEERYSTLTAEELARQVPFDLLCRARTIVWSRNHVENTPMPPAPNDLAPVKKRNDEPTQSQKKKRPPSLTARLDEDGAHVHAHFTARTVITVIKKVFPYISGPGIIYAWHLWRSL